MAQKVLILGDSGTGKSASLRNFIDDEILVINAAGKPLPFRNKFECVNPAFGTLTSDVLKAMDKTNKKVIVIDDAQYIMSFQYMRRIKENGWDKWNDIQGDFFNIIHHCDDLPKDTIVYFLSHIQRDGETGFEKIKTMGKMLDEKITLEGLFTTVLKTSVQDGQYCFLTQNSGKDTVKSPIGMFDTFAIDNDLKYVDTKIRNYYEIGDFKSDEEVKAMDAEASKPDIEKPDPTARRRRRVAPAETADVTPEPAAVPTATVPTATVPLRKRREAPETPETPAEAPVASAPVDAPVAPTQDEAPKRRRRRTAQNARDAFFNVTDDEADEIPFKD